MFKYEIKKHKKDGHEYAEISGFDGKVENLTVPEQIDGYKVEAIGNHAFSGREDIVSVTISESVKTIYGFAFHNCRNLKKITLFDSLDDYYDGVCRQCDSLEEVEITINRSWYEVIRNFLADVDKEMRFLIHVRNDSGENGSVTAETASKSPLSADKSYSMSCLTFPGYVYDFNENTMARTIQFSIAGAGMFYRECVDRRKIDYRQYDKLFDKAIIDGGKTCHDIAIGRLLYPVELEEIYKNAYETYLNQNGYNVLERIINDSETNQDSITLLEKLLDYKRHDGSSLFSDEAIEKAVQLSSSKGLTILSAVLMDKSKSSISDEQFFTL
ncbi:leucine-rich repeat protein [Butyrivibrio sp. YAB3001]|uniref:leucine-rich repeat protein n=1 Tax=Butyrivibrio sp. YAB3001 TaxID=1520812 RepID=UPI0008F65A04|nr:leucine-rich repeat protein [Butyrivibrio sp. YAB3001]SFB76214.1 Leucine rich repeat-containing protein [Butyrivibrio sp. YAB3001]